MPPFFYKYLYGIEESPLSTTTGIRIRDLFYTDKINPNDVFVIDKYDDYSDSSLTYHIRYDDLLTNLYGENATLELNDLVDVNTAGVQTGDALIYNGSHWVPGAVQTGGGGSDTDYDYILFNSGSDEIIFEVTIGDKTDDNQYKGHGSDRCYYINGQEAPNIMLPSNRTFTFVQDDTSSLEEAMYFYSQYTNNNPFLSPIPPEYGVVTSGSPGNNWRVSVTFTNIHDNATGRDQIVAQTPNRIFYHAAARSNTGSAVSADYMGNVITMVGESITATGLPFLTDRVAQLEQHVESLLQVS